MGSSLSDGVEVSNTMCEHKLIGFEKFELCDIGLKGLKESERNFKSYGYRIFKVCAVCGDILDSWTEDLDGKYIPPI